MAERPLILIRGGGDLATGVAARLYRSGFSIAIAEIAQPRALRRLVALAEAIYEGEVEVEGLHARRVEDAVAAERAIRVGEIPVLVDPSAETRLELSPAAIVDARMLKAPSELGIEAAALIVGLGPGFSAGVDCHAVVETNRGHKLGRVYWSGSAEPDTGRPESVRGYDLVRVLRAPATGTLEATLALGSLVREGEQIALVGGVPLTAPFDGALRGLLRSGLEVEAGAKLGDLDPRAEPSYCFLISDKALAVGGGVLEALLSRLEIRRRLGG